MFLLRDDTHTLVVHIYVDDIIFGSTNPDLVTKFVQQMKSEFEMSMVGRIKFFLGLQVNQRHEGTPICQQKYLKDIWQSIGIDGSKPFDTMSPNNFLGKDEHAPTVDPTLYRGIISSLLYHIGKST